jgi:hypothetical protein
MLAATETQIAEALDRIKASRAFRDKEDELDFVAVCLIGYQSPVPIRLGSNATKWPVRVVVSRDPEQAAKRADLEQPLHELVTLEFVWTRSDADARRLKAALDEALIGDDPAMIKLRHSWRDCAEPSVAWGIFLSEAMSKIRSRGENVEIFTERMRVQKIANAMRGGAR